ncbi:hypothetical protein AGMMS50212_14800 [Spirochaetia bacterium]|nr:hypothetical protein AGMMS50212_14800 [Spirochaetia bacterium]
MEIPWEEALAKASEPRTEKPRLSSITLTADDNTPIELEFDPEEVFYLVDLNGISYGTLEITATPENEDDTVNYINPAGGILESPQTGDFFTVQVSNERQSTTYIVAITGGGDGGVAGDLLLSLTVGGSSVAIAYTMYPTYAKIGYPAGTFDIVAGFPSGGTVTYSGAGTGAATLDGSGTTSTITCGTLSAGVSTTILITVTAQNRLSKTYALILYRPDAYYVKNDGNDNNSGETAAAPFYKLKTALDAAQASNGMVNRVIVIGTLTGVNSGSSYGDIAFYLAGTENSSTTYGTPGGTITISGMNNAVLRAAPGNRVLRIGGGHYLNFEDITLTGGSLSDKGGGIIMTNSSHITLSNGTKITGNYADNNNGGGVYIDAGTLTIAGADISNNTARSGGGVYIEAANVTFTQGAISGNLTSSVNGGGITSINSHFTMDGGNIYGNSTNGYGGGVFIQTGTMTYNSGIIKTNVAPTNQGKSIYAASTLLDGTIGGTLTMSLDGGGELH